MGKTTIASKLNDVLNNSELIKINDLAISNNLVLGNDFEKGYKIIDIDKLDILLTHKVKESNASVIIVEGHLAHFCSNPDYVIILRVNPSILNSRLMERNYSNEKIQENLEAEALAVCSVEAFDIHGEKVNELDVSHLDIDEIIFKIKKILSNEEYFPVGEIDFMDYFLNNS